MISSLLQGSYQFGNEKSIGDSILESCSNNAKMQEATANQQQNSSCIKDDGFRVNNNSIPDKDSSLSQQQRDLNYHLHQHEREQHLHQLQSINNLLLEPSSPLDNSYPPTSGICLSPGGKTTYKDVTSSGFEGLGITRGSLMNQREQAYQNNYNSSTYNKNYYQQYEDSAYCSNHSSNIDVPSSPNSIDTSTPATPSTPRSLYSNPYSYSSVSSSPYAPPISSNRNSQFSNSPVRSPCYGRAIRGTTPNYSDCSSPIVDCQSHFMNCNGSRSNSPSSSDTSGSGLDGPLADIMSCLSMNQVPHQCHPPSNMNYDTSKCCQSSRSALELQKWKKHLHNQQRQSTHHHHHHHTGYNSYTRTHHFNQTPHPILGAEKGCCNINSHRFSASPVSSPASSGHISLDRAARIHRNSAAGSDANYTWSGELPPRAEKPEQYSQKIFAGGMPYDINNEILLQTFKQFGPVQIEWPQMKDGTIQKGFNYLIFDSEKQVKHLLSCCTRDYSDGVGYYYKISTKRMKGKGVQIIPWDINDSQYSNKSYRQQLDPHKTVFVGALHGMITATALAKIMDDLFDNVVYVGLDTDKKRYPIGSARVTFSSKQSYLKAINAAFVEVKTSKFKKVIQVDPYLDDQPCSNCYVQQGHYFCRESTCFKYFCHTCWQWQHSSPSVNWHQPMSRGLKKSAGLNPTNFPRKPF